MNKYILILIAAAVILGVGIGYKKFGGGAASVATGQVREITITAQKNKWNWDPEDIVVTQGDTVKLTIINQDDYDHGFAIDAFGISQRVPALATIEAQFIATQPGDFPFYCSVPCGEGVVDGKTRGHFDQVGKVRVIAAGAASTEGEPVPPPAGASTFERTGTWEEVREALKTGNVEMIVQSHDLTVKVTLKNGTVFTAKEPEIDAIFTEIRKCGEKCAGIIQATE